MKGLAGITNVLIRANDLPPTALRTTSELRLAPLCTQVLTPEASVHLLPHNTVFSILQRQPIHRRRKKGIRTEPRGCHHHPPPLKQQLLHPAARGYGQVKLRHWTSAGAERASWYPGHARSLVSFESRDSPRQRIISLMPLRLMSCLSYAVTQNNLQPGRKITTAASHPAALWKSGRAFSPVSEQRRSGRIKPSAACSKGMG